MTGTAEATIRAARPDDGAGCGRVYVDGWRNAYAGVLPDRVLLRMSYAAQTQQWKTAISRCVGWDAVYVVETPAGKIAGVASSGAARATDYGFAGEVFTLYLDGDWHGLGLGRALLHSAFEGLRNKGCRSALVWVLAPNPARFFYAAVGGRRIAQRQEKLWGELVDEEAYGWSDLDAALNNIGSAS